MDADDIVLVALMNKPRDMEIVRTERWYRIPAKHAPPHITQTSYVAFYLTKSFGDGKWSVREYAPVRGHELVHRRDLFPDQADHPRADEPYYKLELGPLIELRRPITSQSGRRILFILTTGDKFSRAVEINDLLGRSEADDSLWDALKASQISAERQIVVRDKRARYRVDFWIRCARGNLAVVLGDTPRKIPKGKLWRALQFSTQELTNLTGCTHRISKLIKELGGTTYNAEKIS